MYKIILKRVIQNESLSKFLTSAIGVIFVTNLWIISYTNILTYLSFLFPPVVNEHLLRNIAFPNPFKIPLYLFLTTFLVVGIWFLYSRFSFLATKRGQQTRELLKWLLFLFLVFDPNAINIGSGAFCALLFFYLPEDNFPIWVL